MRILEAGPGTGPFTDALVRKLLPGDELVLVELNDRFVEILRQRLSSDTIWIAKANQIKLIHGPVEDLPPDETLSAELFVACPLTTSSHLSFTDFSRVSRPPLAQGHVQFLRVSCNSNAEETLRRADERQRLSEVGAAIRRFTDSHEIRSDRVFLNLPPLPFTTCESCPQFEEEPPTPIAGFDFDSAISVFQS